MSEYGNFVKLKYQCKPDFSEWENLWSQYNPKKVNNRLGLSLTSIDGNFGGKDLDSLVESKYAHEMEFNVPTPAYSQVEDIVKDFEVGRSHVLRLSAGGHFPPHRDMCNESMRLLLPLKNCNPPYLWFMLEDKPLYFEHNRLYYINTKLEHTVFCTCERSEFIVFNVRNVDLAKHLRHR